MKNIMSTLLIIAGALFIPKIYNAECSDDLIIEDANKIKISQFANPSSEESPMKSGFNIDNIPDDIFVVAVNKNDNSKKTYKDIKNGLLEIDVENPSKSYTYEFRFYSTDSVCENELVRRTEMKSLSYNRFSLSLECEELDENIKYDGCKNFSEHSYDADSFLKGLEKAKEEANKEPTTEIIKKSFYSNYYWFLIPVAILGVYYVITLKKIKRRKKQIEEE